MEPCEDRHNQMGKMWHSIGIKKSPTLLRNWWKDEKKTHQGGFQEAYSNIKAAAEISAKFWPRTICDKCILHMFGPQGKCGYCYYEKHPSAAKFCKK